MTKDLLKNEHAAEWPLTEFHYVLLLILFLARQFFIKTHHLFVVVVAVLLFIHKF